MTDQATLEALAKFKPTDLEESLEERAADGDGDAEAVLESIAANWAEDEPFDDEIEVDPLFAKLDEWNRAELLKAIREDDGRRCIDVLKRAAA